MALLDFGTPPVRAAISPRDYLPWLEHRCFDRACSYCLEHARVLEVDHVEPQSLSPLRAKDPTNLLPACGTCNGPVGKWDYHPAKVPRKKCPHDHHGFPALDPRRDDLASLYELGSDGALDVRPGPGHDRALWNRDVLLRLNRPKLRKWRQEAQELVAMAEYHTIVTMEAGGGRNQDAVRRRDVAVRLVADRLLFIEIFEIPLSDDLRALAFAARAAERGPAPI